MARGLALRDEGMAQEADVVEGIMRNRTLLGVENQCRYYCPDGPAHCTDRGPTYPGCHWYQPPGQPPGANVTTPWASQTVPGSAAASEGDSWSGSP